jgi:hypothetical protein
MAYDLIGTQTLTGTTQKIEFTNIPAGYKDLQIIGNVRSDNGSGIKRVGFALTFNNESATSRYKNTRGYAFEGGRNADQGSDSVSYLGSMTNSAAASNYFSPFDIYISNYATSNNPKAYHAQVVAINENNSYYVNLFGSYSYNSASVVSSIQLFSDAANLITGSTATLYGIK